jgi:hypothetical protein
MANLEEQILDIYQIYFDIIEKHPEKKPSEFAMSQFKQENELKLIQIDNLFQQRFGSQIVENIITSIFAEKSRGISKAIRYEKENLAKVVEKELMGNYNDTLTVELMKKDRKITNFHLFCKQLGHLFNDLNGLVGHISDTINSLLFFRRIYKYLYVDELTWDFEIQPCQDLTKLIREFFDDCIKMHLSELHGVDFFNGVDLDFNTDVFFTEFSSYYKIFKYFVIKLEQIVSSEEQLELTKTQDQHGLNLLEKLIFFVCYMFLHQIEHLQKQIDLAYQFPDVKTKVYNYSIFMCTELESFFNFISKFFNFDKTLEKAKTREIVKIFVEKFLDFKMQFGEFSGSNIYNDNGDTQTRLRLYRILGCCSSFKDAFEKALELNDKKCVFDIYIKSDIEFGFLSEICNEDPDLKQIFINFAKAQMKESNSSFKVKKKCLNILKMDKDQRPRLANSPIHHIYNGLKNMQKNLSKLDPTPDNEESFNIHDRKIISKKKKFVLDRLRWVEMVNNTHNSQNFQDLENLFVSFLSDNEADDSVKLEYSMCILKAIKELHEFRNPENEQKLVKFFFEYFKKFGRDNLTQVDPNRASFLVILDSLGLKDQFREFLLGAA